jgi:hypothetical protein
MSSDLININPGLLALIEGTDLSLLQFARELIVLECNVAGTSYQQLDEIEPSLHPNDKFILLREPDNKFDTYAVAIYTSGKEKLGYLPRQKNETIARLLDAGKTIFGVLVSKELNDDWLKLVVEIYLVDR